jgi:RND family efflux transporter MFP subunit
MTNHRHTRLLLIAVLAWSANACNEDNADSAGSADQHHHEVVTIWTDSVELFFEHPELVVGNATEPWTVHLTALSDFEPIADGELKLRFTGPDGNEFVVTAAQSVGPGVFTPVPSFPTAGTYDLEMQLTSTRLSTGVLVGPVRVHESHEDIEHVEEEAQVGITFLKEQQWSIEFATDLARPRAVPPSVGAAGQVIPTAGRMVEVTTPVDGLVLPDDNRAAPVPGEWVRAGDTLAVLAPVSGDDAYALQVAREQRLALAAARAERLYELEAIPARRLEDAKRDLEVARAALSAMGASAGAGFELSLCAPISGVIDQRALVLGQRVAAGQLMYSIVDPRTVWLRLDVSAHHATDLSAITGATFQVEGSDKVHRSWRVVSVGQVIDRTRRTLPVVFEVGNVERDLRIGMLAEGLVLLDEPETGVAIPAEAVRDEDGLYTAYVQVGGETFERRVLTLGPSDGAWTIVRSGLRSGERVVTKGAYQVKLATLSTAEFSDHGHAH